MKKTKLNLKMKFIYKYTKVLTSLLYYTKKNEDNKQLKMSAT